MKLKFILFSLFLAVSFSPVKAEDKHGAEGAPGVDRVTTAPEATSAAGAGGGVNSKASCYLGRPSDGVTDPLPGSENSDGRAAYDANCRSCHKDGRDAIKAKARMNLKESDPLHMPRGKIISAFEISQIQKFLDAQ